MILDNYNDVNNVIQFKNYNINHSTVYFYLLYNFRIFILIVINILKKKSDIDKNILNYYYILYHQINRVLILNYKRSSLPKKTIIVPYNLQNKIATKEEYVKKMTNKNIFGLGTDNNKKYWNNKKLETVNIDNLYNLFYGLARVSNDDDIDLDFYRILFGNIFPLCPEVYNPGKINDSTYYHVWEANINNWNKKNGEDILDGNKKHSIGKQRNGIFGIITTPFGITDENRDKLVVENGHVYELADESTIEYTKEYTDLVQKYYFDIYRQITTYKNIIISFLGNTETYITFDYLIFITGLLLFMNIFLSEEERRIKLIYLDMLDSSNKYIYTTYFGNLINNSIYSSNNDAFKQFNKNDNILFIISDKNKIPEFIKKYIGNISLYNFYVPTRYNKSRLTELQENKIIKIKQSGGGNIFDDKYKYKYLKYKHKYLELKKNNLLQ